MTICNFSCVFFRKRINISITLVSESYVILYCEKNVICNSSIKICLNEQGCLSRTKRTSSSSH